LKLRIKTPARLHFGLLNPAMEPPKRYGGFGLSIGDTGFELYVEESDELRVNSTCGQQSRIEDIVKKIDEVYGTSLEFEISVKNAIPPHIGLGSTTQLTLALGSALTVLSGDGKSPVQIAKELSRGKRSGIGTYAFDRGGFLVEGGGDGFPPLIFRRKFPGDWRLLTLTPDIETGPDEDVEDEFFEDFGSSSSVVGKMCSRLVLETLPALIERDIESFGRSLTKIDEFAGEAFMSQQGGKFKDDIMGKIKDKLLDFGAFGVGQSSWGPTIYALTGKPTRSERIRDEMLDFFEDEGISGNVSIVKADNSGAFLEVLD